MKPVIFISGINSGLGLALAKALSIDYQIIGSIRRKEEILTLKEEIPGLIPVILDFEDLLGMEQNLSSFLHDYPGLKIFALINNAGIAVPGAIIDLPIDNLLTQFKVNVFGHFLVIQKLFERLIPNESRVINISSVSGLFASPFLGAYAGSKFALEGLSDSLRRELKLFGIKVILIEPGPIKTKIWRKNLGLADKFSESRFRDYLKSVDELILQFEANAFEVEKIIPPIIHSIKHKSPKNRYLVHKRAFLVKLMTKIIPSSWVDNLVYKNLNSKRKKIRPL